MASVWVCREVSKTHDAGHHTDSTFDLTFWREGSVSGTRTKLSSDWEYHGDSNLAWYDMEEVCYEWAGFWDVTGRWDKDRVVLTLLSRSNTCPVTLTGRFCARDGLVTSVQIMRKGSRGLKDGLELVREDPVGGGGGQMELVSGTLSLLDSHFLLSEFAGCRDLTLVAVGGREGIEVAAGVGTEAEVKTSARALMAQSDFFRAMNVWSLRTKGRMLERVELRCSGDALQFICDFICNVKSVIDADKLEEVMQMADFLGIGALVDSCERVMATAVDVKNCLGVWALGQQLGRPGLVKQVELFLLHNLQSVLSCPGHSASLCPKLLHKTLLDPQLRVRGAHGVLLRGQDKADALKGLLLSQISQIYHHCRLAHCRSHRGVV